MVENVEIEVEIEPSLDELQIALNVLRRLDYACDGESEEITWFAEYLAKFVAVTKMHVGLSEDEKLRLLAAVSQGSGSC